LRGGAAVAVLIVAAVSFYFLAPVVFWFNFYRATPPTHNESVFAVYRSLGCEVPGIGLTYTTYGHVYLTCNPQIPTGASAERVTLP